MKRLLTIVLPALAACAGAARAPALVPMPEGVYRVIGTVGTTGIDAQLVVAENVVLISNRGTCPAPAEPEARREAARTRTLTVECGYRVVFRWTERGELSATGGAPVTTERVVGRECEVWNTDRLGRNTTCRRWTDVVRSETHWQMGALSVERVRAAGDGRAESLARDVVAAANAARVQAGVARLASSAELGAAAADYARELAGRGTLSHTSIRRGYTTLMERLALAGARVVRAGENLGAMSARSELPVQVIRMWLDSEGHRRNLLNPAYTLTGAGVAAGADGTWYFVQVYAAPADTRR